MKTLINVLALCLLTGLTCQTQRKFPKQVSPNVIVIVTDDQGWGDIGYNNPAMYTPNLDKLAAEGAIFINHYSMPQCTPTRIALFTGRYPGRFGTTGLQATNEPVLPKGIPTLATLFKNSGYRTFLCGKWHMGSHPDYGPNHYGFDESYGSLAGAVGMYDHRYRKGAFEITWHRNHDIIPGYENGVHVTDLVANEAISYIHKQDEQPYFMYLAFHAPHTPLDERGDFTNRPTQPDPKNPDRWLNEGQIQWFNDPDGKIQAEADPEKRLFMAAAYHVDNAIGKVIEALEETGQRKNTLILFTSDNGPQVNWVGNAYPDDLQLTDFNQPIPMKGSKLDVWEGGIHVPGFANWPEHISPRKIRQAVHVVDWFPTLAGLIGAEPKLPAEPDGVDLSPLLFGNGPIKDRSLYWINNPDINRWALRFGDYKIVKYGTDEPLVPGDWQLFNLRRNPKEETDLSQRQPEVVARLHQLFVQQRAKDKIDPK